MTNSEFNSKFAAKPTTAKVRKAKVAPVQETVYAQTEQEAAESLADNLRHARDAYIASLNLPSSVQVLVSFIAGLTVYGGIVWLVKPLIDIVAIAAFSLTGSGFLTFMVCLLGYFALGYFAAGIGYRVGRALYQAEPGQVVDNVVAVGHDLKDAALRRVSVVRGWFTKPVDDDLADVRAAR